MNEFMNGIALRSFSNFDIAKSASSKDAPERFYHGFVLGLMVELSGRFVMTSNRERGKYELCSYGRYDVMLTPIDKERDSAYIIEFNSQQIRRYGFAFQGKECLIG